MNIGPYLKQRRLEKQLTLSDVAAKMDCSISYISIMENGKRLPKLDFIERYATAINIPVLSLLIGFYNNNIISTD